MQPASTMQPPRVNALAHEKSPYLLQHQHNPVDWLPWGPPAFEKAARENKPIFLSIGYATCHWCHVMAHESFEDRQVADFLNNHFVAIKVDREENADVDRTYMDVCTALTGSGGWPLSCFLAPDGKPFFAGTYFPRENFLEICRRIHALWSRERERVLETAQSIIQNVIGEPLDTSRAQPARQPSGAINEALRVKVEHLHLCADQLREAYDPHWGGFNRGRGPKFPTPHQMQFLLRHFVRNPGDHEGEGISDLAMTEKTLYYMRQGGIFDRIGAGLHRYATERRWRIPHFEKMLYDQALVSVLLLEALQATQDPIHEAAVRSLLGYVCAVLLDPVTGAFAAAEDADSEGQEGMFYLWSRRQVLDACLLATPPVRRMVVVGGPGAQQNQDRLEEYQWHPEEASHPRARDAMAPQTPPPPPPTATLLAAELPETHDLLADVGISAAQAAELFCRFYQISATDPAPQPTHHTQKGEELLEGRVPFTDPHKANNLVAFSQALAEAHRSAPPPPSGPPSVDSGSAAAVPRNQPDLSVLPALTPEKLERVFRWVRARLQACREARPRPLKDDKVIACWNGFVIAALAKAAQVLDDPGYAAAGARAADFIFERMVRPAEGSEPLLLSRRYRDGQVALAGFSEDYAAMVWGCTELYEATFEPRWLDRARQLQEAMITRLWNDQVGSFRFNDPQGGGQPALGLQLPHYGGEDGALPAANSVAALNLARLGLLLAEPRYRAMAVRLVSRQSDELTELPIAMTAMMCAADALLSPELEITLTIPPETMDAAKPILRAVFRDNFLPFFSLHVLNGEKPEDLAHIVRLCPHLEPHCDEARVAGGQPRLFLCENKVCAAPLRSLADIRQQAEGLA
ncbi:putative Spermatogenesis-associated protein 20 [Paratrimastix pyriformis]|uniref:Spermatogenesis-associated protein 20 n=1 Tax=Paratrimastix pyriformis TaxID=342808 RepID=A0ABQ8U7K3_9EUKA|nr:putative Spermatogenesis-associated protein 20 [Paratrimastix pyriformis]